MFAIVLAGCATAPIAATPDAPRLHQVTCAGVRVPLPPSLRVVQVANGEAGGELIAASRDVALAVFEDGPARTGHQARVIEEIGDDAHTVYRLALRDADRCTFRAVVLWPASADGLALLDAVAGTTEPGLYVGSPRVPHDTALAVLLREVEEHL